MDEEIHKGQTYMAAVLKVSQVLLFQTFAFHSARPLHLPYLDMWRCLSTLSPRTCHPPRPYRLQFANVFLSHWFFILDIAQWHICCLLPLCLVPQAAEFAFLAPRLVLLTPYSIWNLETGRVQKIHRTWSQMEHGDCVSSQTVLVALDLMVKVGSSN